MIARLPVLLLPLLFLLQPGEAAIVAPERGDSFVNSKTHDGESLACDLPGRDHIKNIGSHLDGLGMCVFSSIEMAARWQGLEQWRGWRDWCATNYGGGGCPEKVDRLIAAYAKHKGIKVPEYVQFEGRDLKTVLEVCDRTQRMACITYGYSPRYGSGTIAHMTCCPKFSGKYAVCLDNNFPGESSYEWMSLDEIVNRIRHPSGSGWVFVWIAPPPPPVPSN